MSSLRHVPFRMCVGCRRRREKGEMIRFVQDASGGILIGNKNAQGRGFYLCLELACLNAARKKMRGLSSLKPANLEGLRSRMTREKDKQEEEE